MTEKPHTRNGDLTQLPAALLPLTEQPRWVVWDWELRKTKTAEKWTKPPRQARDPRRNAKSNDPATWGSYDIAVNAVLAGNAAGIGFMLAGSDIGAIDLDHCVDKESATLDSWAERLHDEAIGAYQEITVSGGGLRIIGTVSGAETHRKFTFDRNTGAGIELYRNTARYITISGLELGGPCVELPPLDTFIDRLLARHTAQPASGGLDFNNAGPQQSGVNYDDLIQNGAPEGERSELFQAVVWYLAGKGWTVDQITDELARHPDGIGAKYPDRLQKEVKRSYSKWRSRKHAAVNGDPASSVSNDPWPQVRIISGELPRVVDEAEAALLLLERHKIYQRGGLVVRPVRSKLKAADGGHTFSWQVIPVTRAHMVETLTRAAQFQRFDGRSKAWVHVNAPDQVAQTFLDRRGGWKLPVLAGITNTPFLRRDRSLCERPGYDSASELLFHSDGQVFPAIAPNPDKADAAAAIAYLDTLIATFPFVTAADRAVAMSAILTAVDRRCMLTAPLHAFTAPTAGTGKSLLVDVASLITTGQPAPAIAQGRTEEELEKRLGTALMEGDAIISIDNCEYPVESAFLCAALTQQRLKIRVLGQSRQVEVPANALIFANGNNLQIANDLTRRSLLCTIDAGCECPELRSFDVKLDQKIKAERGQLVAAALTILRAWHLAQEPARAEPLGSFEEWSQRIREPLLWLGYTDPCDTMDKVRYNDPRRSELAAVMLQWKDVLGVGRRYTIQEVINAAISSTNFQAALVTVAGTPNGLMINNMRLGRWLKKVEGKIVNNLSLARDGMTAGYPFWKLASC